MTPIERLQWLDDHPDKDAPGLSPEGKKEWLAFLFAEIVLDDAFGHYGFVDIEDVQYSLLDWYGSVDYLVTLPGQGPLAIATRVTERTHKNSRLYPHGNMTLREGEFTGELDADGHPIYATEHCELAQLRRSLDPLSNVCGPGLHMQAYIDPRARRCDMLIVCKTKSLYDHLEEGPRNTDPGGGVRFAYRSYWWLGMHGVWTDVRDADGSWRHIEQQSLGL